MNRKWLMPALCGLVYAVVVGLAWIAFRASNDKWIATQTIAVGLTGLVLIWYTWETRRLGEEARRQTALQLRPYVIVEPVGVGDFQVRNVGHGPAFNIRVADVVVSEDEALIIHFPHPIPVLVAGGADGLQQESSKQGRDAGDFFLAHLASYATRPLSVTVECQDAEGRRHRVRERVRVSGHLEPGGIEIEGYEALA